MKKIMLIALIVLLSGCASVISKDILKEVDRDITLDLVQADPASFTGRKVLWGGSIISTENLETVTVIEVLETRLAFEDVPADSGSRGRFLVEAARYLDPAVYKKGMKVTVAGVVKGVRVKKIGRMDYTYPVLAPLEVKLIEPLPELFYRDYPQPYWWYNRPYYFTYPWPYWPRYPYYPYTYPYRYPPY
ncbi:MAG: Slp family lipoprotein [Thermodesulfobacteriota bacterium]